MTSQEYCQFEIFRPECWKGEVVVIEEAVYGRRKIGRCLKAGEDVSAFGRDPRYLGCYSDVMALADNKCSGKSQCEIRISDLELDATNPCYEGLKMYLEASYSCAAGKMMSSLTIRAAPTAGLVRSRRIFA